MRRNTFRGSNSGLTLVDLMATLAVAMVLVTVGVPGLSALVAGNRMAASTNDLVTHLQYARSESIKRQLPVSVCASNDGQVCSGSTEWGAGWIVFTDAGGTAGNLDGSDQLLRSYLPTDPELTITSQRTFVRYLADGSIAI